MSRRPNKDYFICAHCGARLPAEASFCRECGASEGAGWESEEETEWDADEYAREEGEDYDEFLRREFPEYHESHESPAPWRRAATVALVLLLCLAFLLMTVLGF